MELTQAQKDVLALVENEGDYEITNFNEMNVPVNIFISQDEGRWRLSCDGFMPRKLGGFEACVYTAATPEPLRKMVELFIKPFYETALKNINGLVDGTKDSHYYWE